MAGAVIAGILTGLNVSEEDNNGIGLPVLSLKLNGTTLDEIHDNGKEIKYGGNNLEISYNDIINSYRNVEIKGRGNYSWWATDKKSYRLKFDDKVDLFGMGAKKKWALIANSADDALMRNDLAYFISDIFGGEYKMEGKFVELVIDGADLGVYYLVKAMEIDKQTMDLRDSLGVLVELDNVYCKDEEKWYETNSGDCLTIKDVAVDGNEDLAMEDFLINYNRFLKVLKQKDFKKIEEIVDIKSFARYFLISEFAADPDAYATSWYFYKDGAGDKIHAGPVWDFDAAFGNRNWGDWDDDFYAPTTFMGRFEYTYGKKKLKDGTCSYDKNKILVGTVDMSWTMCDLLNLSEFRDLVGEIYVNDFRYKKEDIKKHIYEISEKIMKYARKDSAMWGRGDFDAEVSYLVEWVEKRFEFFNEIYATSL